MNTQFNSNVIWLQLEYKISTLEYHSGLRSRELGQAPMQQVFLTPRQELSSHPRQQMV